MNRYYFPYKIKIYYLFFENEIKELFPRLLASSCFAYIDHHMLTKFPAFFFIFSGFGLFLLVWVSHSNLFFDQFPQIFTHAFFIEKHVCSFRVEIPFYVNILTFLLLIFISCYVVIYNKFIYVSLRLNA